jgi:hypothetical protein
VSDLAARLDAVDGVLAVSARAEGDADGQD